VRRHAGLVRIAEASVGIMGRTPDYKNVTFAGFAARWQEWAGLDGRNAEGAQRLVDYQKHLRRNDVALTHTIVHPTIDKARESVIAGNHVPLHKVGETAEGIVLRGARILATSAPFADELAVYPGFPLPGDGVEPYALSFAIPMDSPGLIFLCHDSYATPGVDPFDRPLSSRMDEQDAFVIFDDVVVPWERVFIDGDVGVYNSVMRTAWWPNIMQQTTIRALTKLEFAYGLGSRMARHLGDRSDATLDQLGQILCYLELTRAGLLLSIEHARDYGGGAVFPDDRPLLPLRATLTQWIPRVCEILMQIGSHNLLATPSRSMLDDRDLRPLIDTYLATADDEGAEARSATFRLAWNFIGSALGGRNDLYERFYLGSTGRNRRLLEMGVSGGDRRRCSDGRTRSWTRCCPSRRPPDRPVLAGPGSTPAGSPPVHDGAFIAIEPTDRPGTWRLPVTDELTGGMGQLFGGVGLGAGIAVLESLAAKPVAWATAQFLANTFPGEVLEIDASIAVQGNNFSQGRAILRSDGRDVISVVAAFGSKRYEPSGSWRPFPQVLPAASCPPRPLVALRPSGIGQRIELRQALPSAGSPPPGITRVWARFTDGDPGTMLATAIVSDFLPLAIRDALDRETFGTSLDNTIRFVPGAVAPPGDWLLAEFHLDVLVDGVAHGVVCMWTADGTLLSIASQTCNVRDAPQSSK